MKKWRHPMDSMTPDEKKHPETIKHSRVQRIAKGSGLSERDVRELLKYFKQTQKIMKMTKGGKGLKKGPLAKFAKQFGLQV
jgi:signal recognition particle subunit SRP54